jgi:hypothetical protein
MSSVSLNLVELDVRIRHDGERLIESKGRERRRYPRIYNPFLARVKGVSAEGNSFECLTAVDNLSFRGLYLRVPQRVEEHSDIEVAVQFSANGKEGTTMLVTGRVLRADRKPGEVYGLAAEIKKHKFLWK